MLQVPLQSEHIEKYNQTVFCKVSIHHCSLLLESHFNYLICSANISQSPISCLHSWAWQILHFGVVEGWYYEVTFMMNCSRLQASWAHLIYSKVWSKFAVSPNLLLTLALVLFQKVRWRNHQNSWPNAMIPTDLVKWKFSVRERKFAYR